MAYAAGAGVAAAAAAAIANAIKASGAIVEVDPPKYSWRYSPGKETAARWS